MATRTLKVVITGETRGLNRAVDEADRKGRNLARVGGLIAGAFSGAAIVAGAQAFIGAAKESAAVSRQTEAVLKSTRQAAGLNARQFADLAGQISKNVAVDDDLIQSGENILATFTNIKDAGPNKIFSEATAAAVDMAAAMNHGEVTAAGLQSANIQLGKALNDPIKGLSSLTRVGVTFTEKQKDQIKGMVEAGNVAGAQKVILGELRKEFGGSAAAAATSGKQLSVTWGDMQETLGQLLIPVIDKAAKALMGLVKWVDENRTTAAALGATIAVVTGFVVAWNVATKVAAAVQGAVRVATLAWTAAQWLLNAALDANPIGIVIVALAALAAGLIYAYKHSETFRKIVDGAFDAVVASAKSMWAFLRPLFQFLVRTWLTVAEGIVRGAAIAFGWVPGIGPKLRTAAEAFGRFKDSVNRSLNGIDDERVNVTARAGITWTADAARFRLQAGRMAAGGLVTGPGTSTSDSVPALLSRGEFVFSAAATRALGADQLRALNAMHFAAGGLVPAVGIRNGISTGPLQQMTTGLAAGLGSAVGSGLTKAMAAAFSAGGAGGTSGSWRRAIAELIADGVAYSIISTFRAGARTHASGAVSFHALNRAVDLVGPNMMAIWAALTDTNPTELIYSRAPMYKSRRGWRPISQLDPITRADHYSHVHVAYDRGGWLPPGLSMAYNGTGRPERVLGPGQGGDIVINFNAPVYGDRQALTREIRSSLKAQLTREGKPLAAQL